VDRIGLKENTSRLAAPVFFSSIREESMLKTLIVYLFAWIICAVGAMLPARAADICEGNSKPGDVCICALSELHPTQASVGMTEVRIRREKLKQEIEGSSEDFPSHLRKQNRIEPIVIGPGNVFYITDGHHLVRALYDLGQKTVYCKVIDNVSTLQPEKFWKYMKDNNEVYLKDNQGNVIKPGDLPKSIGDLRDDPFRSLAGAIRESCGFRNDNKDVPDRNYLEFKWADYLRAHWAQTSIEVSEVDAYFDRAIQAAQQLAIQKEAATLPGYTGKASCQ
jgi:hypothetical protein